VFSLKNSLIFLIAGGKKCTTRRNWSPEERTACLRQFQRSICLKTLPGKDEILKRAALEPALTKRNWLHIKNFIRNQIVSLKRQSSAVHKK
jgi:hypothetical protein